MMHHKPSILAPSDPTNPLGEPPSDRDELYSALVALRNAELAALWARFNIHLVLNGGLLATVASLWAGDSTKVMLLLPWAKSFGLVLSVVWLLAEFSGRWSLQYRDRKIEAFEEQFFRGSLVKHQSFAGHPDRLYAQEKLSYFVIGLFIASWIGAFFLP